MTDGRRSLRLDAGFCAAAGFLGMLLAGPLSRLYDVPRSVIGALGAGSVVWATLLVYRAWRRELRPSLRLVATVNVAAALGFAGLAVLEDGLGARLLLVAVAIVVAAFGAVQFVIFRRTR